MDVGHGHQIEGIKSCARKNHRPVENSIRLLRIVISAQPEFGTVIYNKYEVSFSLSHQFFLL